VFVDNKNGESAPNRLVHAMAWICFRSLFLPWPILTAPLKKGTSINSGLGFQPRGLPVPPQLLMFSLQRPCHGVTFI
jgi:hypothetical protein